MTTALSFTGFNSPNTTPVPDQLFDELLTVLSGNELKVLLYIIRRTFGFKKDRDNISLNQMLRGIQRKHGQSLDGGVGLSKPTLLNALQSLVRKGIIFREHRSSKARGNLPTAYCLKLAEKPTSHENAMSVPVHPLGKKSLLGLGKGSLPTTRNSKTRKSNNVVKELVKRVQKPKEQVDYLIDEMEQQTGDKHSRGNFAQLATLLPDHTLFQFLAEMRQDAGIRNRGAWITSRVRQSACANPINAQSKLMETPEISVRSPGRTIPGVPANISARSTHTLNRNQRDKDPDPELNQSSWKSIGVLLKQRIEVKQSSKKGYRE